MKPPIPCPSSLPSLRAAGPDLPPGGRARFGEGGLRWQLVLMAIFLLAVASVMIRAQIIQPREEPWRSATLAGLRERLREEPKSDDLKKQYRELDQQLRIAYFRGLERNRAGAWMLAAAGVSLLFVARRLAAVGSPQPARLLPPRADRDREASLARTAVVSVAVAAAGVFAGMGIMARTTATFDARPAPGSTAPSNALAAASVPRMATLGWDENWPRFLGNRGSGTTTCTNLPLVWEVGSGTGIQWKATVRHSGYSSPVVWGRRVFLTGGDRNDRWVSCFDTDSGEVLWEKTVRPAGSATTPIEPPDQSGPAASSPATDGERVFAIFATGEVGALDFEGRLVWSQQLDFHDNSFGHASSLVAWRDRLFVQGDQGQPEDGRSTLLALDARTGTTIWSVRRPVGASWATPVILEASGTSQLIAAGDPWLISYDPASSREMWRARLLGGELAPSPIFAGGLVIASSPGRSLSAVRPDGSGEVTSTYVAWKIDTDIPDVPTPVATGDLLFTADTGGRLVCRELRTGARLWAHEFENEIQASPLCAGDRIYVFAQSGKVFVVEAGREFKQLASFDMEDEIYASPAVVGEQLLVRTKTALYGIRSVAKPRAPAQAGRATVPPGADGQPRGGAIP